MAKRRQPKKRVLQDHLGEFRWETYFVGGKQRRRKVRLIDGIPASEWELRNADPVYLHQTEQWELMEPGWE